MSNIITYDFSQGRNFEKEIRPNRALKRAWAQDFTLPAQYTDIDSEEMQYIDGGYKVGTYSANDNSGADYLFAQAKYYFICAGINFGAVLVAAGGAAALAITGIGAVVMGVAGACAGILGSYSFAMGCDASNALEDVKYKQSIGQSYSVYCNRFGKLVTGFTVR